MERKLKTSKRRRRERRKVNSMESITEEAFNQSFEDDEDFDNLPQLFKEEMLEEWNKEENEYYKPKGVLVIDSDFPYDFKADDKDLVNMPTIEKEVKEKGYSGTSSSLILQFY